MKIDRNNDLSIGTERSGEPGRATDGTSAAGSGAAPGAPGKDQLSLSPDAQVIRAVLDQMTKQPEIRQDLVERMRALDAAGQLGRDAGGLADAMIERWLTTP
jgi:flagellar biosynthesis anti-sigma factor FlgM